MENITLIRHPKYDKTPHFNVDYETGRITRLDGSDSLVLLKNEQELTTYTFQLPRFYNDGALDILRNLYQIEVETYCHEGTTSTGSYGDNHSKTVVFRPQQSSDPNLFIGLNDVVAVNSLTGEYATLNLYDIPGNRIWPSNEYDTVCFSYKFPDLATAYPLPLMMRVGFYTSPYVNKYSDYYQDIKVVDSNNLLDNKYNNVKVIRHPDYPNAPHFYVDPNNAVSRTDRLLHVDNTGVYFDKAKPFIVTFQMSRYDRYSNRDMYTLTKLYIHSTINERSFDTFIKSGNLGVDDIIYVNSTTGDVYTGDDTPGPEYDTMCFSWDMSGEVAEDGLMSFEVEGYIGVTRLLITNTYSAVESITVIDIKDGMCRHPDYPSVPHFSIDTDNREIRLLTEDVVSLGLDDQNGARLTFQVPRILDDTRDLYDTTSIYSFFVNTSSSDPQDKKTGGSICKQFIDKQPSLSIGLNDVVYVDASTGEVFRVRYDEASGRYTKPPENFDTMCFSWVVPAEATTKVGNLAFSIRFAKSVAPDNYIYHSAMYTGISVTDTLNLGAALDTTFSDTLSAWYDQFCIAQVGTEKVIADLLDKATEDMNSRYATILNDQTTSINKLTSETIKELKDFTTNTKGELESLGGISVSAEQPTSSRTAVWVDTSSDNDSAGIRLLEDTDIGGDLNWYTKIDITNTTGDDETSRITAFSINQGYVYGTLNGALGINTTSVDYMYGVYKSIKPGTYEISTYCFANATTTSKLTYYVYLVDADGTIVRTFFEKPASGAANDYASYRHMNIEVPATVSPLDLYVISAARRTYGYSGCVCYTESKNHDILGNVPFMIEQALSEDVSSDIHESLVSPNTAPSGTGWVYGHDNYPMVLVDDNGPSNYTNNYRYIKVDNIGIGTYDIATRAIFSEIYPYYAYVVDSQGIVIHHCLPSKDAPETATSTFEPYTGEITVTASDIINNNSKPLTLYLVHSKAEINGSVKLYWSVTKRGSKDNNLSTTIKAIQGETPSMTIGRRLVDAARNTIMGYNRDKKCLNFAWITDTHINGNQGTRETIADNNLRLFSEIAKERFLDFAATGGDMFTARGTSLEDAFKYIGESMRFLGNIPIPLFNIKGNHDNNAKKFNEAAEVNWTGNTKYYYLNEESGYYQVMLKTEYDAMNDKPTLYTIDEDNCITSYQWATLMQNNVDAVFDTTNPYGGYFYKDFADEKVRVLVLNDFDSHISDEFATWSDTQKAFIDAAFNLPSSDWGVVVLTHTSLTKPTSGANSRYEALNKHTSKIICFIHGHDHMDLSVPKGDGQWLTIGTNAGYGELIKGEVGTEDEFSIDIFTIDTTNRKIYDTRIGRGENREFSYK